VTTDSTDELRQACDNALAALNAAIDGVYAAIATYARVDRAVWELGAEGGNAEEQWNALYEQTHLADLNLALNALQSRLVDRHSSSVPRGLADYSTDELRAALQLRR
jgi:hypothetical protein